MTVVPIAACLFCPTIMAHSTMAAPELSMQLSIVCRSDRDPEAWTFTYLELNHPGVPALSGSLYAIASLRVDCSMFAFVMS